MRDWVLCIDACSLRGHIINDHAVDRLGNAWTGAKCARCGEHLWARIDPEDDERYIWQVAYDDTPCERDLFGDRITRQDNA